MTKKINILEPRFYMQNFLKIRTKTAELIPFKFNYSQNYVMGVIEELKEKKKPVRIIMLKARQLGMSTFTEGYIFNDTSANKLKNSMIVAHLDSASQNLYQMYRTFYENLPEELTPMIKHSNKQEMTFENPTEDRTEKKRNPGLQSKVTVVSARTVSAGRSQTIHNLHACLSGDSLVVLSDGSTKKMEDVQVGDKVMTSSGQITPVTFKSNTGSKQTYELSVWQSGEPIYATENHKILTLEGYKELKNITKDDYIAMPKISFTGEIQNYHFHLDNKPRKQDGGSKHIEDFTFPLNRDFGYLLGYYLAEGHVKDNFGYTVFTYHKNENYIQNALKGTFGLETSIQHKTLGNKKRTIVYGKFLSSAIENICGRVSDKHIPEWFFKTNKEFIEGVVTGYLDGDGSKSKQNRISAPSIHEKIARQIKRLVLGLNYGSASVKRKERYRYDKKTKDIYLLEFSGDTYRRYKKETVVAPHKATKYKIVNDIVYCKVKNIVPRKVEPVYDIEVGHNDHNYETTSGIVSNSEVAFWNDAKTLMTGLMQTIPEEPNTSIIIESTANGIGGWFYDIWKKAESGENDFVPIFLGWYLEPEYSREFATEEQKKQFKKKIDAKFLGSDGKRIHTEEYELMKELGLTYEQMFWREHTIKNKCNGDIDVFRQEYPSSPDEAFIASGRPRFSVATLKKYLKQCTDGITGYFEYGSDMHDIQFIPDPKGYITIWEEPKEDMFYCIGADVAEGLEKGDYSVGVVGDDDLNIVASWRGHIDPDLFGKELVKMAKFYNEAYLGVESNNHGLTTLKAIQNEEYYNIYYSKIYDKIAETVTQKIGWGTNRKTKPLMIDRLAEWIREKWIGIPWKVLIQECLTYVREDNGSTNAQTDCYDDTVMATAILLQLHLEGKGENFKPFMPEEEAERKEGNKDFLSKFMHRDLDEDQEDSSIELSI